MKYTAFLLVCLFYACASVDHPKGGPLDETPPTVLNHTPDSNTLAFRGNKITFDFDEYVEIKDPNAIIISPPLAKKPDYSIKGKSLVISLKDTLRSNTTYTIQLTNAIQDITEKNILPNHVLSFSTGNRLDTLTVRGQVILNATHEKQKDITVALFHPHVLDYPDSQVFPLFTTRTQEDGSFLIQGLPPSTFTLYAFEDINFNNRIETGEKVAYLDSTIEAGDSTSHTLLLAKYELLSPFRLGSPSPISSKHFKVPFTQNRPGTITIKSELPSFDKTQKIYYQFVSTDTLLVYDSYKTASDSNLTYYFYLNEDLQDSLTVDFEKHSHSSTPYQIKGLDKNTLEPFDTLYFHFNEPLLSVDTSKLRLLQDSTRRIPIQVANTSFASYILFNRSADATYSFIIQEGAFKTLEYTSTVPDTLAFRTPAADNYGSIQIKWEGQAEQVYKIELLKDKKEKPNFTLYADTDSVYFKNIPAGTYYARISAVTQRSPTHLIPFKKQVEPYFYYPKPLELRGLWTIEDVLIHIH